MTDTIPPCPVCGEQPTEKRCRDNPSDIVGVYHHKCTGSQMYTLDHWQEHCSNYLGRALRAAGITTIAQLTERLAPDPRVAVLDADHHGMKMSASGIMLRPVDKGRKYMLKCMYEHLEQMAARFYAGEISVVDEFLQLYDLADDRQKLIAAQRGEEQK